MHIYAVQVCTLEHPHSPLPLIHKKKKKPCRPCSYVRLSTELLCRYSSAVALFFLFQQVVHVPTRNNGIVWSVLHSSTEEVWLPVYMLFPRGLLRIPTQRRHFEATRTGYLLTLFAIRWVPIAPRSGRACWERLHVGTWYSCPCIQKKHIRKPMQQHRPSNMFKVLSCCS